MNALRRRVDALEATALHAPWGQARFVAAELGIPFSALRANAARQEALYARLTAEGRSPQEVAAALAEEAHR